MTKSISIGGDSTSSNGYTYESIQATEEMLMWKNIKKFCRKLSLEHVRAKTVYSLLIISIAFTLLGSIATSIELSYADSPINAMLYERRVLPQDSFGLKLVRLSSFVLLGITCTFALVALIKRDKFKARLLSMVRETNVELDEQVQRRTIELAEALKAKDHFLGIATHDLKAPLNGILGLVNLIKIERNISERESEYFMHIEDSCKKMQSLINDILEVNRIEQGKAIAKKETVDLGHLMNEIRVNFAQVAANKDIQFVVEVTDGKIDTDRASLTRILENLVSNAIKFSPFNKTVWLKVKSEYDSIRFEVIDQGLGIPVEDQPKLFTKFQRLSNRPTGSEISTGLGLSIVKELTTQLGGEITFISEVGKGSTFVIILPQSMEVATSRIASKNKTYQPGAKLHIDLA